MCGLFFISDSLISRAQKNEIYLLLNVGGKMQVDCALNLEEKVFRSQEYSPLKSLVNKVVPETFDLICGHSRLMTDGQRQSAFGDIKLYCFPQWHCFECQ